MPNLHSERHQQIECGRQIGGQHGSVEYKYIDYKSQTRSVGGVREKCIVSSRECSQRSLHHMFVYCTLLPKGQLDIFFSFQGFSLHQALLGGRLHLPTKFWSLFSQKRLLPKNTELGGFDFSNGVCVSMPQQRTSDAKAIQKKGRTNVLDFLQFTLNTSSSTLVLQLLKN